MSNDVTTVMNSRSTASAQYDVRLGTLGARLDVAPADSEANVAVVEHTLPPLTLAAPRHRHSREDEISYVLDGEMTVLADDELTTVSAGESVVKERNVWHTFWNAGDERLRFLEIIAPGEFSGFFEDVARLGTPDPTDEQWVSRFRSIGDRYGVEFDLERTPELLETYGLRM
jgi:quercetin dioxygenase-like cupin family protein